MKVASLDLEDNKETDDDAFDTVTFVEAPTDSPSLGAAIGNFTSSCTGPETSSSYHSNFPIIERSFKRRWDVAELRELRERLNSNTMSIEEMDNIANRFMDEIADLASDWLGNTVVQKLFEMCSASTRFAMLERLAPHLATIGVHKNGTWAAQKIVECVQTPQEISLVTENLKPYSLLLFLDQFGSRVLQCCLRFGSPTSDFIFDAMADRLWVIVQGKFGARAMLACLESNQVTSDQRSRVASAILENAVPLSTNPNGTLLLTWLLDTSGIPSRYGLLASRFLPLLVQFCTHKLASSIIFRIVNQNEELEASSRILRSLFVSTGDQTLKGLLNDQVVGVSIVHDILKSYFVDGTIRSEYLNSVKRVLIELEVAGLPAYRKLVEEVGLLAVSPPLPHVYSGEISSASGMTAGSFSTWEQNSGDSPPPPDSPTAVRISMTNH